MGIDHLQRELLHQEALGKLKSLCKTHRYLRLMTTRNGANLMVGRRLKAKSKTLAYLREVLKGIGFSNYRFVGGLFLLEFHGHYYSYLGEQDG